MARCGKCKLFTPIRGLRVELGWCSKWGLFRASVWHHCDDFEFNNDDFLDELDEYLFENHQVKSGCCSSAESLKYIIAREVAEKMIEKFGINIQYISQEERRKRMDAQYGDLSAINKLLSNK